MTQLFIIFIFLPLGDWIDADALDNWLHIDLFIDCINIFGWYINFWYPFVAGANRNPAKYL